MQADGAPVRLSERNRTGAYSICDRREPGRPKIEAATASQNVPAVSLYLKTGFTEAGQIETPEGLILSFFHLYPKRKAEVVPYKPEWKEMFEREKADLIRIFGPALHSVSHIGKHLHPADGRQTRHRYTGGG